MPLPSSLDRRALLGALATATAVATLRPVTGAAQPSPLLTKPIPSTGEPLPVVGLGSWITFNVCDDEVARAACAEVMRAFFDAGGRVIDSSPMYGSSQAVIGDGLARLGRPEGLFSADKVWISSPARGPAQAEVSRRHWGVARFDLLQVHNLLSWEEHLATLLAMKAEGRLRYVGITTSEGRRHRELEQVMRAHPLDFVHSATTSSTVRPRTACSRWRPSAASPSSPTGRSARVPWSTGSPATPCPPGRRRSAARPGPSSPSSSSSPTRP